MSERLTKNGKRVGRPPGAANLKTRKMEELREEYGGQDPASFLWWLVNNRRAPLAIRAKAAADLMPFLHPKLSAVQVKASINEDTAALKARIAAILARPDLSDAAERLAISLATVGEDPAARIADAGRYHSVHNLPSLPAPAEPIDIQPEPEPGA